MSAASPTFSQIRAQVSAIRQKIPQARTIGIRAPGRWTGPAEQREGSEAYLICQCNSPLAMRLALRQAVDDGTTKILLTPLEENDLSDDILIRLAKRRLFQIDSWQIVRTLFQAHAVDPRLSEHAWIADALLEAVPAGGYPAARGGFLDAETVWPLLLRRTIGLTADEPDLTALLRWSLSAEGAGRFRNTIRPFQEAAIAWLVEQAGAVAGIVLPGVARWERPDAVPLGLAAGVVFHPAAAGKLERPVGKLEERYLDGATSEAGLMQRWSAAATEVVRALRHTDSRLHRQTLQRTDEILREIGAEKFAYLSDTSLHGFDQRLAEFGGRLSDLAERQAWDHSPELLAARDAVRSHDQSAPDARRLERVQMAMRLVRWLAVAARTPPAPRSLAEAANDHLGNGGFVDWARLRLRAGDPVRELSEAYARLFGAATQVREQQAAQFARLLVDWTAAGSQGSDLVPVERILESFVAPLAAERPVLLVVIDGMSMAVCRELLNDLARHEWIALCESGRSRNRPGIAVIPSKTEFSRTSLLCGQLRQGVSANEQAGFTQNPALLANSRAGSPPILFHKVALEEERDAALAKEVRDAIQSSHRKIVGVVVNAVDDHLAKGSQIDVRWSHEEIRVLPALLHEARNAGRLVILLSDHGHVVDCQAEGRPADGGERWRLAAGTPAADELLVQGSRVLVEGQRLIAPWSERVRYGGKKNGYHGGLSPQEMVVPIVVLSSTDDVPGGWQEQPVDVPVWWDEPLAAPPAVEQPQPRLKTTPKPSGRLFDPDVEEETTPPTAAATEPSSSWVTRLLASPVYEEQKRLAGRGLPSDDVVAQLLTVLDARGGKLTTLALARTLTYPEMRLPGLLAKVQRLLNVDGYAGLNRDDASQTVELNRDLLLKQFDLVEE